MAVFRAERATDMREIDFNFYLENRFDVRESVVNGKDVVTIEARLNGNSFWLDITGQNFTVNENDARLITTGTVQGLRAYDASGTAWEMSGISVGTTNFTNAWQTATTSDDFGSFFAAALSGNDQIYGSTGVDFLFGFNGNDEIRGNGVPTGFQEALYGDAGADILIAGSSNPGLAGNTYLSGRGGADTYVGGRFGVNSYYADLNDTIDISTSNNNYYYAVVPGTHQLDQVYTFAAIFDGVNATLIGTQFDDRLVGNELANVLRGGDGADTLRGAAGNDTLDGGSNVDTAVVSGQRSQYTITQPSLGVFDVTGPDGTDRLTNVEYLDFAVGDPVRLLWGQGTQVNFNTSNPSVYQSAMENIRDFDGNDLGGDGSWLRIGSADVNGDGDVDQILVNDAIGRFATVGTADDGLVYFNDYSWAGETRVVGIYIDPLVQSGQVQQGSDLDSQRRFQNDLQIENINEVLGADDYDGDGLQEVYLALTDGTAYLHLYMFEDGNIQYANYQSEAQVIDYLESNGYDETTYGDWFTPN
ncbi:calcium-binding protein [Aurantiacibacter poecillastricola]|uniref:calcium-binding protein n=1 Tax=Aurantiacibacter poecillastricola TaxID=3064385 RepID=UPI00273FA409|nr:calcium-binding protein [Aurantiacibacter sp. 219JJ12-13]MDP5261354.1 calcium-binding protein [Aurantiacibacter sp. 219JJ12-13]